MEIRCTAEELKELLSNRKEEQTESREQLKRLYKEKTPVAGTTDAINTINIQNIDCDKLKEKLKENLLKNQ